MKKITPFIVYGILLLFTACAKEDLALNNGPGEPLFKVSADLGGAELLLEAGENDFYLFTENGHSPNSASFNPITRFAKLSSCENDCLESFSIEIRNIPTAEVDTYFNEIPNNEKFDFTSEITDPGHLILTYQDSDGMTFSTTHGSQGASTNFNISTIQGYEPNENGQQTKLLQVDFSCELFNNAGASLLLTDGQMVFAVALP